jgi:predicted CoA-binding protein
MDIKEEFVNEKCLAVVGVSRTHGFGNAVLKELRAKGYGVFPVNAKAETVEGERCSQSLDELAKTVGGVVTVVPPEQTKKIVEDCAAGESRAFGCSRVRSLPRPSSSARRRGFARSTAPAS